MRQIVLATRRQGWRGLVGRANGGMIVHVGVVIIAVALAASSSYSHSGEFLLAPGESATLAGHRITYLGIERAEEEAKTITRARVQIDGGRVYEPALSRFPGGSSTIGTPSVRTGITGDVYLTLLDVPEEDDGQARIGMLVMPLAVWLWIGGTVMAIGTALAAWPGRRRRPTDPVSAPVPDRQPVGEPVGVGVDG
jgi:cytochrome c-type biogenesis protein CcmF